MSGDIRYDGKNYIVSNAIKTIANLEYINSDDPYKTNTETLNPSDFNTFLTVEPSMIQDGRPEEVDADDSSNTNTLQQESYVGIVGKLQEDNMYTIESNEYYISLDVQRDEADEESDTSMFIDDDWWEGHTLAGELMITQDKSDNIAMLGLRMLYGGEKLLYIDKVAIKTTDNDSIEHYYAFSDFSATLIDGKYLLEIYFDNTSKIIMDNILKDFKDYEYMDKFEVSLIGNDHSDYKCYFKNPDTINKMYTAYLEAGGFEQSGLDEKVAGYNNYICETVDTAEEMAEGIVNFLFGPEETK